MDRLFEVHMNLLEQPELLEGLRPELAAALVSEGVAPHETSILGEGVVLNAPCVLEEGVEVGDGTVVGPNTYLGAGVVVEAGAKLTDIVVLERRTVGGILDHQVLWAEGSAKVSKARLRANG